MIQKLHPAGVFEIGFPLYFSASIQTLCSFTEVEHKLWYRIDEKRHFSGFLRNILESILSNHNSDRLRSEKFSKLMNLKMK